MAMPSPLSLIRSASEASSRTKPSPSSITSMEMSSSPSSYTILDVALVSRFVCMADRVRAGLGEGELQVVERLVGEIA